MSAIHYHASDDGIPRALCGWIGVRLTSDAREVTCKLCLRRLSAIDPLGNLTHEVTTVVRKNGAREPVQVDNAAPRPPWLTVGAALRELVEAEDNGFASKSCSDPSRFELLPSGGSSGGTRDVGQREAERLDPVWRARAFAVEGGFEGLPAQVAAQAAVRRILGEPRNRGDYIERCRPEGSWSRAVVDWIAERHGFAVTAATVDTLAFSVRRSMRLYLAERSLLPRFGREGDGMTKADVPWDYEGWFEIAKAIGKSERSTMRYAQRKEDPLPVHDALNTVVASKREVEDWLVRQMRPRRKAGR